MKSLVNSPYPLYNRIMSQVLHLFQLQKIDTELDQITSRLHEISSIIQSDRSLQIANQNVAQTRANAHRLTVAMRNAEESVSAQRIKIETCESNLYGGKINNPKELQDLQNEIASLKKYLIELENLELDAMLILEQAENEQKSSDNELVKVQSDVATRQAGLLGEKTTLERHQERLLVERQVCNGQISTENLAIYNRLREQKRGLAVSSIEDGACQACGSSLRPAELQSARSPSKLFYCSSCGRIVYAG